MAPSGGEAATKHLRLGAAARDRQALLFLQDDERADLVENGLIGFELYRRAGKVGDLECRAALGVELEIGLAAVRISEFSTRSNTFKGAGKPAIS
jgi:hypothetical protein